MEAKRLLRASVLAARETRPAEQRVRDARDIAGHAVAHYGACAVVATYASVGTEPPTSQMLDGLLAAGVRVLLPAVTDHALRWGAYRGWPQLRAGPYGLLEPEPDSDATSAALHASAVLVPALAVGRDGHRLGRGGGYFDRWLAAGSGAHGRLVAVVYDDEVLDFVPHEDHDVPVAEALTPGGVIALSR